MEKNKKKERKRERERERESGRDLRRVRQRFVESAQIKDGTEGFSDRIKPSSVGNTVIDSESNLPRGRESEEGREGGKERIET